MQKLNLTSKSKHGEGVDDSMRGLSAVFVDGDRVFIDNGAVHAKSELERGVQFVKTLEEVPNPRTVWGVWITLHRFEGNVQGYYGATCFVLHLDGAAKVAYKSLAQQVNNMEKAVRGNVDLLALTADARARLGEFLGQVRPELWQHASSEFRAAFEVNEPS